MLGDCNFLALLNVFCLAEHQRLQRAASVITPTPNVNLLLYLIMDILGFFSKHEKFHSALVLIIYNTHRGPCRVLFGNIHHCSHHKANNVWVNIPIGNIYFGNHLS